ncbi:MAG: hypothetical protein DHS20C14_17090 [Phycisphaeraceae bacterium]|nr:MAG: hypothetical protein DHS20C14_17090 [Phycisphaeraceae bacterium]
MDLTPANTAAVEMNAVHVGDAAELMKRLPEASIDFSVWSPPYSVGKEYERGQDHAAWEALITGVLREHARVLRPGRFVAVNIADILCFADEAMPRVQAENVSGANRLSITREQVLEAKAAHPGLNRYGLAELLGVSEQTIDRRLNHNNIRGGKPMAQTRVKLVGSILEAAAYDAGLYLYDQRVWAKDPCWANSRWHSNSYRAVDEFEHVFVFWRPGITKVDRGRLSADEWRDWGSRGIWQIPSVRANDDHEAKFPIELPRRLIRLFTDPGDVVLDPFLGSGTSAVAAVELGRGYVGFELSAAYAALARERVAAVSVGA